MEPKLRLEAQSRSSPLLTQHFQVKVAASCTSCVVSHTGVASCVIDLGLDDLHSGIQVDEFEMGGRKYTLPFFEPWHSGGWGPIRNTQQRRQVSSDYSHILCAPCSIQTRRDWEQQKTQLIIVYHHTYNGSFSYGSWF